MRNWNWYFSEVCFAVVFYLLFTYEELKLMYGNSWEKYPIDLLFTYEELKQWSSNVTKTKYFHLLFTYEELKHSPGWYYSRFTKIYYLPMRNWNFRRAIAWTIHLEIYYLPMRNWNSPSPVGSAFFSAIYYLPMRNWN